MVGNWTDWNAYSISFIRLPWQLLISSAWNSQHWELNVWGGRAKKVLKQYTCCVSGSSYRNMASWKENNACAVESVCVFFNILLWNHTEMIVSDFSLQRFLKVSNECKIPSVDCQWTPQKLASLILAAFYRKSALKLGWDNLPFLPYGAFFASFGLFCQVSDTLSQAFVFLLRLIDGSLVFVPFPKSGCTTKYQC